MKVIYFRLKGYVKVLNGMGLDEISIPFHTFKNRIILVQGENGCAKSTIISALSPNVDSSDSYRTDVFIDSFGNRQIIEYPAEKEIHYEDDEHNIYKILIQSIVDDSKTRRTTKAYISKNGEEMNPNGNVGSFKEIRDALMGIDPIYLDLSSISAENRGIVDMIPSDRRKYMASYIGSLETYNNIFKVISKKVSSLKSYINTLNSKIYELGNENEMRLNLLQLEDTYKSLSSERDNLVSSLASAEATVSILDPDNKIQDTYNSISNQLQSLNFEISKNKDNLVRYSTQLSISLENSNIDNLLLETQSILNKYNENLINDKANLSSLISINEVALSSLESDRNRVAELSSIRIQSNIESAVLELEKQKDEYVNYLSEDDISILQKISIEDLLEIKHDVETFEKNISIAEDLHSEEDFMMAIQVYLTDSEKEILPSIQKWQEEITTNEISINSLLRDIEDIKSEMSLLQSFSNTRPINCTIDTCPYISKFILLQSTARNQSDIDNINLKIKELRKRNSYLQDTINKSNNANEILTYINSAFIILHSRTSQIAKIPELSDLLNISIMKNRLINHARAYNEIITLDQLIEKSSIYKDLLAIESQLSGLTSDLKIYNNNKSIIDSLQKSIEENEKQCQERESSIKTLTNNITFTNQMIKEFSTKLELLNSLKLELDNQNKLLMSKNNLREEFEKIKNNIRIIKEKMDSVNLIRNQLQNIDDKLIPLNNTINNLKHNLANIVEYQQELKENADKYDKMEFIKKACSPGNGMGIQSEYIKRYMNDIIIDCNKLLGFMFDGSVQLNVPIINEKQFSIPFIGPGGLTVPDISNGSTAQKCMIGLVFSCIAMMKSSQKYNIPRFDEIDGGLDHQNRIMFINVLNQILDFMDSEQCIICSHNIEFDEQNTTRLICTHQGISVEQ